MNLHAFVVAQPTQMLKNLKSWLEKAKAFATEKKFEVNTLMQARLAPDQFALVRQVQSACDSAKGNAARLAGKDAPSHPDTETTIDELQARIDTTVAYLDTFAKSDFDGAEERKVSMTWMQGKHVLGGDFVREFAIANFQFPVTHAYAILRHNGVPVGKMDYIGTLSMRD